MGADMTIATFPVFGLNNERKARIMASLVHEKFEDCGMEPDAVEALLERLCAVATKAEYSREALHMTQFDRKGTPMKVVLSGGMGDSPTELHDEIYLFHYFCSNQSLKLMDSYAKQDHRRPNGIRLPAKRGANKSNKCGVPS